MTAEPTTPASLGQLAADLLSEGKVGMVIGYGNEGSGRQAAPVFIRTGDQASQLIFDDDCFHNLAVYLPHEEIRQAGRVGLVVEGRDRRAVNVLLREHVIQREDVFLIGVRCSGVGQPTLSKCAACDCHEPQGCDAVVGEPVSQPDVSADPRYPDIAAVEDKPIEQRWDFWKGQFEKCIRCYACRQVCPLCYCKRCLIEKSMPQWIETSAHLRGNLAWNVARALHLTGRCVGCGECERVCPMHIPLGAINQKMAKLVAEWFGFRSGLAPDEQAPFTTFTEDDPEEGIL